MQSIHVNYIRTFDVVDFVIEITGSIVSGHSILARFGDR